MAGDNTEVGVQRPLDLRDYWDALVIRWYWIVGGAVLGMVGALLIGLSTPAEYEASASVLLEPLTADPLQQLDRQNAIDTATERQIALSRSTAEGALELLDPEVTTSPDGLRFNLSVNIAGDSQVLDFTYASRDPAQAQERANAFAMAYLADRRQRATQVINAARSGIEDRLDSLSGEIDSTQELFDELSVDDDDDGIADGDAGEVASTQTLLSNLRTRQALAQAELEELPVGGVSPGTMISPAVLPEDAASLSSPLLGLMGTLLGGLLGLLAALFLHSVDSRLRSGDEVSAVLGTKPVGFVVDPNPRRRSTLDASSAAGQLRRVAATLDAAMGDARPAVVVLVETGTSGTADAMAPVLADGLAHRQPTVLVRGQQTTPDDELETAFSRVQQHQEQQAGRLPAWIRPREIGRADVVDLSEPSTPVGRFTAALQAKQHYDMVVVTSEPLDKSIDAVTVGAIPDTVLVPVVRLNEVSRADLLLFRRDLDASDMTLLGPIILGPRRAWGRQDSLGEVPRVRRGIESPVAVDVSAASRRAAPRAQRAASEATGLGPRGSTNDVAEAPPADLASDETTDIADAPVTQPGSA